MCESFALLRPGGNCCESELSERDGRHTSPYRLQVGIWYDNGTCDVIMNWSVIGYTNIAVNIAQCLVEYGADAHRTNKRKVTPLNICHNLLMSRVLRLTPTDFSQIVTHVSVSTSLCSTALSLAFYIDILCLSQTRPQPRKQLGNPLMHIKSKKSISSHLSKPSVADQEEENSRQVESMWS